MKDQHTARPWKLVHDGTAIHAAGRDIARIYMKEGMTLETHNANGRIMEAAPDMLVLLREFVDGADMSTIERYRRLQRAKSLLRSLDGEGTA